MYTLEEEGLFEDIDGTPLKTEDLQSTPNLVLYGLLIEQEIEMLKSICDESRNGRSEDDCLPFYLSFEGAKEQLSTICLDLSTALKIRAISHNYTLQIEGAGATTIVFAPDNPRNAENLVKLIM